MINNNSTTQPKQQLGLRFRIQIRNKRAVLEFYSPLRGSPERIFQPLPRNL